MGAPKGSGGSIRPRWFADKSLWPWLGYFGGLAAWLVVWVSGQTVPVYTLDQIPCRCGGHLLLLPPKPLPGPWFDPARPILASRDPLPFATAGSTHPPLPWDLHATGPGTGIASAEGPQLPEARDPLPTFRHRPSQHAWTRTRAAFRPHLVPSDVLDPDDIRVEQLVARLPQPYGRSARRAVRARADAVRSPHDDRVFVRVGVQAREAPRVPAHLTLVVLDPYAFVRAGLRAHVDGLGVTDAVALVGATDLPSSGDQATLRAGIDALQPAFGRNDLGAAYAQARRAFHPGGANQVVVITDDVAPHGLEVLRDGALRHAGRGITTSVIALGAQPEWIRDLAALGGGAVYGADHAAELAEVLRGLGRPAVAEELELTASWNPAVVGRYRLMGFEQPGANFTPRHHRDDRLIIEQLAAGAQFTALYQLQLVGDGPLGTVQIGADGRHEEIAVGRAEDVPAFAAAGSSLRMTVITGLFAEGLAERRGSDTAARLYPLAREAARRGSVADQELLAWMRPRR